MNVNITENNNPFAGQKAASFTDGDGLAYVMVGVIVPEVKGSNAELHVLVADSEVRTYEAAFLPMFEFFRTARDSKQVEEWLAWSEAPEGMLDTLISTGTIVQIEVTSPLAAAASLKGLRIVPDSIPKVDDHELDGVVPVQLAEQPYDFSEMEIGSLRAAAESTKHFADHKRPARKNPRARWPVFGRTGFKMTQGSSHSLSHWNRKGVAEGLPVEFYVNYELAEVMWGNREPVDIPDAITYISQSEGLTDTSAAYRVITDLPDLIQYGYAHLEWIKAPH